MPRVVLSLGANLGERAGTLRTALDALAADVQARLAPEGRVEEAGYQTLLEMLLPAEPGLRRIPFAEISIPPVRD